VPLFLPRISSLNMPNFASVLLHENCVELEGLVDNYEYVCGFCKCDVGVCDNFKRSLCYVLGYQLLVESQRK
jgi:hypothetical protein